MLANKAFTYLQQFNLNLIKISDSRKTVGSLYGIWTRDFAVKGQWLKPLVEQTLLELMDGLEPPTYCLQNNGSTNWATSA